LRDEVVERANIVMNNRRDFLRVSCDSIDFGCLSLSLSDVKFHARNDEIENLLESARLRPVPNRDRYISIYIVPASRIVSGFSLINSRGKRRQIDSGMDRQGSCERVSQFIPFKQFHIRAFMRYTCRE
jgi:hypothetical protein